MWKRKIRKKKGGGEEEKVDEIMNCLPSSSFILSNFPLTIQGGGGEVYVI